MSNEQSLYTKLVSKLRSTRRKETILNLSGGAMFALALSLILLVTLTLAESLAFFGVEVRTVLALSWLGFSLGAFAYYAGPALLRFAGIGRVDSDDELAQRVGREYPEIDDRLCNALQLYRHSSSAKGSSPELALEHFGKVGSKAAGLDFDVVLDTRRPKRRAVYFVLAALISFLSFGVLTGPLEALERLRHFNLAFTPPAPFALELEPLDKKALRGENIRITVTARGTQSPDKIILQLREERQESFDEYTILPDSLGEFRYDIPSIKRGVEFYAQAPWYAEFVESERGKIEVFDRPDIRSISGTLTPPSYTRLASRSFDENSADIVSLRGSRVKLHIISNKDLAKAELVIVTRPAPSELIASLSEQTEVAAPRFDTSIVAMSIDSRRAEGSFAVSRAGEYFVRITDTDGENNLDPISYSIVPLPDAVPTISLIEPTFDVELQENALLPMKVVIADDYGFSALKLRYRLVESIYVQPDEEYRTIDLRLPRGSRALEVPYVWDLNEVGISPSDRYQFFVEVFDNDAVTGPKSARTDLITVRLPSLDEVFQEAESAQDIAAKELEKVLKEAEELQKEMDELNRDLLKHDKKEKVEWKEQQKMKDIVEKQKEFSERVEDIREQLEDMTDKLEEHQAISPETLEKYKELQNLLKDVNSQEMQKAMERMEQALEQMTPEQMRKAMANFEFNEEQFRKSIERTMKVLQRVKAEQKADELAKRAEELRQKQEDLQKETENTNANDEQRRQELAEQQEQLQEELDKLSQELMDLEELMTDIGEDVPMFEMQKAIEELQKQQTEQSMQQAQQKLQQGDMQQAQQQQQSAQQNLEKFAQRMQDLKDKMEENQRREAMRQMRKSIQDMLELSKRQESLKEQTASMNHNSAGLREQAQEQADMLQDLNNVANNLGKLAEKSFSVTPEMGKEMGKAMRKMQSAIKQLSERNPQACAGAQAGAMGAMNRATQQMQSALSDMQQGEGQGQGQGEGQGQGQGQGQGGMGFMESLQQAAMQQQMINQSMQQLLEQQGQGGGLSQQQQQELGRLAGEQGKVQKSMEELAREEREAEGRRKALGDLDRIAEDMQEIVSDMNNGEINRETLQRQNRILSRLLDARRSIREQDYKEKREGKSGVNVARQSPDEINLETQEGRDRALQELLRSIQQGYTKDYETIIRKYFEALQGSDTPH